jgi:glutathione S-transferase
MNTAAPASSPLRLHYNPMSSSARRVVMTAVELGLPLELAMVVNMTEPVERARLLKINPNAKIPVLEHGDFVLWESCAIMQYLCELAPGQTLYPADIQARADVNRWLFWCSQHLAPALGILGWENFMKPMIGFGDADPREVARGERETHKVAAVLDGHLATRQWLSGERMSLADIAVITPFALREPSRMPLQDYVHLQAWIARMEATPAWQQTRLE